jgi:hypothetical protein
MLGREVRSKRFALAAFLIPLFIRAIPEILVGLYPIGWGTITFYIHNPLDWATGKTDFSLRRMILRGGRLGFMDDREKEIQKTRGREIVTKKNSFENRSFCRL